MPAPRVSILIPNFNNGRESSCNRQRDFMRDLLESLEWTLRDEETPFEILAHDDGSTDDSRDTLREWARRTWSDGRAFLTLTEAPHTGSLAVVANCLSRAAQGDILARLDGDTVMLTDRWVSNLCAIFDEGPPDLGIVAPRQLDVEGRVHEFGDWILHPNGYHHNAHGLERNEVTQAIEVDAAMGAFHCCRRRVFEEIDGYDERFLRGQTVDFDLRARLAGWRCWAVPNIEYEHAHSLRTLRTTAADSDCGMRESLDIFEHKWGFCRLAPDLDEVRRRYAGTPLLWNARWFGFVHDDCPSEPGRRSEPGRPRPRQPGSGTSRLAPSGITPDQSEWSRYTDDLDFRAQIDMRIALVNTVVQQAGPRRLVAHLGAQCGLIGHILARNGLAYLGVEPSAQRVDLAHALTRDQQYPKARPQFAHQPDRRRVPIDDGRADLVLICDVLERHPNPVGLLKEAQRILTPGGILAIVARRRRHPRDEWGGEHPYSFGELFTQIGRVGFEPLMRADQDDATRDIVMVARRPTSIAQAPPHAGDRERSTVVVTASTGSPAASSRG